MMNTKKRWLAAVLSVIMVVAMLPSMAFAAETPIANMKLNGTVYTWDAFVGSSAATGYKVVLENNGTGNPGDWKEVTGLKADYAAGTKVTTTTVDLTKLELATSGNYALVAGNQYRIKVTAVGAVSAETISPVYTYGSVGTVLSNAVINGTIASVDPLAGTQQYEFTLYKSAFEVAKDAVSLPTDATEVAKEVTANTYVDFAGKIVKDTAKDNYFVKVIAKRAGIADSKPAVSKSVKGSDVIATNIAISKVEFVGTTAKVTMDTTGTPAKPSTVSSVTYQLYKQIPGLTAVAVGSPAVVAAKAGTFAEAATLTKDFGSDMTEVGVYYYVSAVAKRTGTPDSPVAYTASKKFDKRVVTPGLAYDTNTGKITVTPGAVTPGVASQDVATDFDVTVELNGVAVYAKSHATASPLVVEAAVWNTTGLKADQIAKVKVIVVGTKVDTLPSAPAKAGADINAPTNVAWDLTSKSAAVAAWKGVDGATSYEVALYNEAKRLIGVKTVKETKADLSSLILEPGRYTFAVTAFKGAEKSEQVPSIANEFFTVYAKLVKATEVKWNEAKAMWKAVEGATSYEVTKQFNGKTVGKPKVVTTTETTFDLSKAGDYTFTVVARTDKAGVIESLGSVSDTQSIKVKTVGEITWNKVSTSKSAAKITWKAADNAQRYVVYKMNSKGDFVKKAIVKGTQYRDSSLKSGKTYKYKVAAYSNASGAKVWGEMSAVKTVKTK